MRLLSMLVLLLLTGCATTNVPTDRSIPQILLQQPLPPLPDSFDGHHFDLNIALYVLEDGSVNRVVMRQASGNALWDSAAVETIKGWRFAPAHVDGKPIRTWYYLNSLVQYANPIYMTLVEVHCLTIEQADSVYRQLILGKHLADLETPCGIDTLRENSYPSIGINIYQYPKRIRNVLVKLDVNEFSRPIEYGNKYVIFQRLNHKH
jgi:TonB family protein